LFIFDLLVRGIPYHFLSVQPFDFIYKMGQKPVSRRWFIYAVLATAILADEVGLGKTVQVNKLTLLNKRKITNHRKMVAPEVSLFLANRLHMVRTVWIDLMYHIHISIAIWYNNQTWWLAN
jgi:hypothetical protein